MFLKLSSLFFHLLFSPASFAKVDVPVTPVKQATAQEVAWCENAAEHVYNLRKKSNWYILRTYSFLGSEPSVVVARVEYDTPLGCPPSAAVCMSYGKTLEVRCKEYQVIEISD